MKSVKPSFNLPNLPPPISNVGILGNCAKSGEGMEEEWWGRGRERGEIKTKTILLIKRWRVHKTFYQDCSLEL